MGIVGGCANVMLSYLGSISVVSSSFNVLIWFRYILLLNPGSYTPVTQYLKTHSHPIPNLHSMMSRYMTANIGLAVVRL